MKSSVGIIKLRPFTLADAEAMVAWKGDPEVTQTLFWDHEPNLEATVEFIQTVVLSHPWFMAICLDDKPVGAITLDQGTGRAIKRAELGYVLAKAYWGQGIATEAVKLAIEDGFKKLPIERIEAFVDPDNIGSVRVLEKAGLAKEAHLKKYVVHRGRLRDRFIYVAFR